MNAPDPGASPAIVVDGSTTFEHDTAVEPLGDGRYRARIFDSWWIVMGPNGGYVAAIVLRAVVAAVADDARRPISATFHYLRPPTVGDVEVEVTVERSGRTVTNVSARLHQDGRLLVIALVAVGVPRDGTVSFDESSGPAVDVDGSALPRWSDIAPTSIDPERDIPMRAHYDMRWALGAPPFSDVPSDRAVNGGWIRLLESPPVDEIVLVAMADAWLPPIFSRVREPLAVPTVDLTVHFRGRPDVGLDPAEQSWCFVQFASPIARDGYLVETGSIRDAAGRVLADVRQLAVVM